MMVPVPGGQLAALNPIGHGDVCLATDFGRSERPNAFSV